MLSPRRDFFHGEVVDPCREFSTCIADYILVDTFVREVSRELLARDCLQGEVVTRCNVREFTDICCELTLCYHNIAIRARYGLCIVHTSLASYCRSSCTCLL